MTKGILKKSSKEDGNASDMSPKPSHLTWDEANIHWTEANRTATMKIDEPKTPFVHASDARLREEPEFADEAGIPNLRLSVESTASQNYCYHSDYSDASACHPHDWQDSEFESDGHHNHHDDPEAHKRFLQMRKQHYNMKEGIRRGRELTASEAEDLEDDEDMNKILNG